MGNEQYKDYPLAGKYYFLKGWFFMWMPVMVPYAKLAPQIEMEEFTVHEQMEGIVEKGSMFGRGWVAMKINDDADVNHPNVMEIKGSYKCIEHIGPYKEQGTVYKKIMADYPESKEIYGVYINSPMDVSQDQLRTLVCVKVD